MRAYERLLKYVTVKTPSDEFSQTVPSSDCQLVLANMLADELKELGVANAHVDHFGIVYGMIPATQGHENDIKLGFIAHMDTVKDYTEAPIQPVITPNYDGCDFPLGDSGRILSVKDFPHLPLLKGRTLITSDGNTILGVDDKAGVATIMTMTERLINENIPHGQISIAFTPDEEIGAGADHFDIPKFGAEFAYTVDGGKEGDIQYETFNACRADFKINGFAVHPGDSKDTMINASLVAMEINSLLPGCETPRGTEGYEGFYHLNSMKGDACSAELHYIVRDHDAASFDAKQKTLRLIAKTMNEKWGEGTVELSIEEQYRNMAEIIQHHMHLIENAKKACENAGVNWDILPVRGGTDGCRLSYDGLPCPNLGTGGYAFHGPYEHTTVEALDITTDILVELAR